VTSTTKLLLPLALVAAISAAACGGGAGDSAPQAAMGSLRVALTDAPACGFDRVYVTVERVRVHVDDAADERGGGWTDIPVTPARRIDLLSLTNGVLEELGQTQLPAGRYTQIRLVLSPNVGNNLANAVVPTGGAETALVTPSAVQSGIKLIHPFTVAPGQLADIVLDFDACRSIVTRGNGTFGLKPVVSVLPRTLAGIAGAVDPATTGVVVTAQKNGVVLRATQPTATGAFVLAPIDPARAPYDIVITAPARTTSVVTGVPVTSAGLTALSTVMAPITLPPSATAMASGTVTPAAAQANVRALQPVGSVPAVEVAHRNVDNAGAYSFTLSTAAPRLATYTATLPLGFVDQPPAAKFDIAAAASGYLPQQKPADLGTGNKVVDFALVAAP